MTRARRVGSHSTCRYRGGPRRRASSIFRHPPSRLRAPSLFCGGSVAGGSFLHAWFRSVFSAVGIFAFTESVPSASAESCLYPGASPRFED